MGKGNVPFATSGRFSQRVSNPIGGNPNSGPFCEFPMGRSAQARNFCEWFNDFTDWKDFDQENFQWNYTDGSGSAYGANTARARIADWLPALIGVPSVTVAPTNTASGLITQFTGSQATSPYGVLRVSAGGTDSTGSSVSRVQSGTNLGGVVPLVLTPTNYGSTEGKMSPSRTGVFGVRFNVAENGAASQSAFAIALTRDEAAILNTAGSLVGATGTFGITKGLATNVISAYTRTASNATTSLGTLGTIVPGTGGAQGTNITVEMVYQLRSTTLFVMDVYINGVYAATHQSTIANNTPAAGNYGVNFSVVNGVGADCDLYVDYVYTITERV